jgi:hypothetical protein
MKNIKFVTTFSSNGYNVYGKTWIDSFLEKTSTYDNITAKIYINGMDLSEFNYDKIEVVDYDIAIPAHANWVDMFKSESTHDQWNKDLAVKFSYKSFVMLDTLKNINDGYVIWLDADCKFMSSDFENWPNNLLNNTFVACQREAGSEHVESGIIIFDSEHSNKQKYIDQFESLYMNKNEFNKFGQFFDGFAVGRTLNSIDIKYVDLNEGYGRVGIQSDPSCTFLNSEIRKRFIHNIGITGKRKYNDWDRFKHDQFFQLIHGVNNKSKEETLIDNLKNINQKLLKLANRRLK